MRIIIICIYSPNSHVCIQMMIGIAFGEIVYNDLTSLKRRIIFILLVFFSCAQGYDFKINF